MTTTTDAQQTNSNPFDQTLEPLVTAKAVAAFLGLTPAALDRWRYRNETPFPVYKLGRSVRYRLSEVDAWVRSRA